MKVKYFPDTDTALLEFTANPVVATTAISDDVILDLDAQGQVVAMTIEHARANAQLPEFSYEEIKGQSV